MYQVVLNGKDKLQIEVAKEGIMIDGSKIDWDLHQVDEHTYHLIHNNKSYTLEIRQDEDKEYTIKLNNKLMTTTLRDKLDILLKELGLDAADAGKLQFVKAPMPGLIAEIKVKPGDEVKKGDPLLILEAMKMENIIKSPGEGIVKAVNINKGDGVEKNQVLIQF